MRPGPGRSGGYCARGSVNRTGGIHTQAWALWLLTGGALTCGVCQAFAQERTSLIAPGATIQKLVGGLRFAEGPAADPQGNVYFSDIPAECIYQWSARDGRVTVFRENSGGANGLFVDRFGNLVACEGTTRQITSTAPGGQVTVVASRFAGKRFNRPNNLWIDARGGIYFTDPAYGREASELELDVDGVYYITPDGSSVVRVSADLDRPNGIIGSAHSLLPRQMRSTRW